MHHEDEGVEIQVHSFQVQKKNEEEEKKKTKKKKNCYCRCDKMQKKFTTSNMNALKRQSSEAINI